MSINFSSIPQKRLLAGITSAATEFYLTNILSFDGETDVLPTDLGTQHYCCFRNDTGTIIELMEIDPATISAGPITIVRRGLSFYGDLTTETTDLKLDWPSNSIVMLGTDVPQIFQWLKEYIDNGLNAGAAPASTTTPGLVAEGSLAEIQAGTATKTISSVVYKLFAPLDKLLTYINSLFVLTSAGAGDSGKAPRLNASGVLDNSFLSSTPTMQVFTANGTWTKPAGLKAIIVEIVGAGGAGAGANDSAGTGGGAGGYSRKRILAASLGSNETITVGVGGSGNGGSSSFGSHCSATGGTAGGVGGVGTDGDINATGGGGSGGDVWNNNGLGGMKGGCGGSSVLGGGATPVSGDTNGNAGGVYGGGGGGGCSTKGGPATSGGNGASGIVIVTEYYN